MTEIKTSFKDINPIIKGIFCITFILIFSLLSNNLLIISNYILFIILACFYFKIEIFKIFKSIKKLWFLILLVGIIQGIGTHGWNYINSFSAILRLIGIVLVSNIYTLNSTQNELLYFWELLFRPLNILGFTSSELALTMVISIRFLPVFMDEIDRIKMSQEARGIKLEKKTFSSALNFIPLIIPILNQAIKRSGELADAMEVRGYVTGRKRGRYKTYNKITSIDYFVLLATIVAVIGVFIKK